MKYWHYAFQTTTFLINQMLSKVLEYDSPYFTLFRRHLDYKSLCVFGCLCYLFIRSYNTHKLQYRFVQCLFLGYSLNHKGFLCLDYATRRVYITPHMVFDESTFPFAQSKSSILSNDTLAEGSTLAIIAHTFFPTSCLILDSNISHTSTDSHSLSISESPIPTNSSSPLDTSSFSPATDLPPESVPEPQVIAPALRMTTRSMKV